MCLTCSQALHLNTSLSSALLATMHLAHLAFMPRHIALRKSSRMKWLCGRASCLSSAEHSAPAQVYLAL